jgi:hypothetical protein
LCYIIRNSSSAFTYFVACLGVVLKQARMTKKGKGLSNVGNEVVVDTLVVLADDLVQVVAKVSHS